MPDSDLALDAHEDLDVSGRHAELIFERDHWVLVDMESRNGTFVDGRRINRHAILGGEKIRLGVNGPSFRLEILDTQGPTLAAPLMPHAAGPGQVTGAATPLWAIDRTPGPSSPNPMVQDVRTALPSARPAPAAVTPERSPIVRDAQGVDAQTVSPETSKKRGILAVLILLAVLLVGAVVLLIVLAVNHTEPPDGSTIAQQNLGALGHLSTTAQGQVSAFCTVFAVRPDVLATSARCVLEVETRQRAGVFVQVGSGTELFPIARLWRHPAFDPNTGEGDIGLIQVDRDFTQLTTLAAHDFDDAQVVVVGLGAAGPVGTAIPVSVSEEYLTYPSQLVAGAPLFDRNGQVVGVHSGPVGAAGGLGRGVPVSQVTALLANL